MCYEILIMHKCQRNVSIVSVELPLTDAAIVVVIHAHKYVISDLVSLFLSVFKFSV